MVALSPRSADTRRRLLEAAGEVFAEHGYRAATIQEICRRADANIAAVNYHFTDKEQLYRAVVRYAEEEGGGEEPRLLPPDTPAKERLRAHVEWFLYHLLDEGRPAWHGRIIAREMIEPTAALDELVEGHMRATLGRLSAIVRDLLGPDATEEQVRSCGFSVTGQCLFYHNCAPVIARLYPGMTFGRAQVPALAEHITRFSLAGLRTIAAVPDGKKTPAKRRKPATAPRAAGRRQQR
jgi:AcrR family transcriptional regulator